MKKILTLLIAAGTFISVQAQTSREEARRVILGGGTSNDRNSGGNRDVILGGGNNGESYPSYPGNYPSGNSQSQVDQINREYDNKIQSIRNNSYLSYEEKQRAIRQLEKDRQARIKQLNRSYNDDNRYDDNRYGKKNNGKHKGWNKKSKNNNWKKGNRDRDDD